MVSLHSESASLHCQCTEFDKGALVTCAFCDVCRLRAAKRCSHVVLVWLYLEQTNKNLFQAVSSGADDDEEPSTSPGPVDDRVAEDGQEAKVEAKADAVSEWEAKFRFEHYRLPQDSLQIRDLVESLRHECKISDCSSRGKTGKGATACEHTFPAEFRPPEHDSCARCGAIGSSCQSHFCRRFQRAVAEAVARGRRSVHPNARHLRHQGACSEVLGKGLWCFVLPSADE